MSHARSPDADTPTDEQVVDPYAAELATPPEVRLGKLVYTKRLEFLADLLTSLDMVVYMHICYLYLLDCHLFRLLWSCAVQWFFLSPITFEGKPPVQTSRSVVMAVSLSAALCVLWHTYGNNPTGSEETQGYMHGGVIIDFVGQKGPTSKVRLVVNDILVLVLQLTMHCVVGVKQGIPSWAAVTDGDSAPQDVEDEERGERRRLWNLDGSPREEEDNDPEADEDYPRFVMEQRSFRVAAGDYVVASIDIVGQIRGMWRERAASVPVEEPDVVRPGRAWRLRVSENLAGSS